VVRLNVAKLLRKRHMTAYQLAKLSGLPIASCYRLARPGGTFRRIEARTVDELCKALRCRPGDLFVYRRD
jgi:DNA-binding Xre family transcriptional regulator